MRYCGQLALAGSDAYFAGLLDARFAGREERQFVVGRFEQSTREHPKEFRRRVDRQIECLARDRLLALFAPILPARSAILHFEALFDRRFHVIIAVAFVFDRNAGSVEFPGGNDVIATAAIVVGIFGPRPHRPAPSARFACRPDCPG